MCKINRKTLLPPRKTHLRVRNCLICKSFFPHTCMEDRLDNFNEVSPELNEARDTGKKGRGESAREEEERINKGIN